MVVEIKIEDVFDGLEIEVICNNCGKSLECSWYRGEIIVDPCETCELEAYNNGLEEGRMKQ